MYGFGNTSSPKHVPLISIFKSKPQLKDILAHWQVDIHSHLLPGIDDGCKSVKESTELLQQMQRIGIQKWIVTPHVLNNIWDNTPETIQDALQTLNTFLKSQNISLEIVAAAEYLMDYAFMEKLSTQKLLPLKNNMVLVEMSYINPPIQLFEILYELQLQGYIPVLAHPERYQFYHNQLAQFEKLKKAGCYFQANLASAVGYYGKGVTNCLDELLKNDLIDYIGSDIHHQRHFDSFSQKVSLKNHHKIEAIVENTNCTFIG